MLTGDRYCSGPRPASPRPSVHVLTGPCASSGSLTMISYFSLMPDLHVLLLQSPSLPFRDQLLRLDQRWLSLILMVAFLVAMVIKVS